MKTIESVRAIRRRATQRLSVVVLTAASAIGCVSWHTCEKSADCPGDGVCDVVEKVCVIPDDGGSTDDGGDGGPTVLCAQGCPDWQTCKPTGPATGVCADVAIAPVAPAEGTVMAGTASAVFKFQVTQWDGGVLERASIPVLARGGGLTGPATLSQVGSVFQGEFLLANVLGQQSVTAGWNAVNSTISVSTEVCNVMCAEWQECLPTKDGGECGSLDVKLSVGPSLDGGTVGRNAPVAVQASVWRADGGARPGTVPFRTAKGLKGTLSQGADYTTAIDGGSESGAVEVVVGWEDGGPYVKGRYLVDITPPVLGLVVASDGGAYQRDAVVPAILTSDEAVTDAGLVLGGVAMARTGVASCPGYSGTTGAVGCFLLDFSQPVLHALDGGFAVALSGTDMFGNSGPTAGPTLPVTRVRWTVTPTAHQVQALAVGSDGTLYVGMGNSATELLGLSSETGVTLRSATPGEIQSLAVASGTGGDLVYLAYNSTMPTVGNIGAVDSASFTALSGPCQGFRGGSKTYSGIALYKSSMGVLGVGSVNSYNTNAGYACVYDPANGYSRTPASPVTQFDAPVVTATGPTTAPNVVISTATLTASLLRGDGSTGAWWLPAALTASGSSPTAGTAVQLGGDTHTIPVGQALLGGLAFVGAGAATADARVFTVANGAVDGGTLGSSTDKGVPALASGTEGYVGDGAALVRFNPSALSTSGTALYTLSGDSIRTSPVLGAARPEGGAAEGYAVSKAGTLVVFSQGSSTATWTAALGVGSVVTHPTFDCNRVTKSRSTGILYVGDDQGTVKAIVVDSPRLLETAGAWPKYQRSTGNAGNDDTSNFPTNWGGCP